MVHRYAVTKYVDGMAWNHYCNLPSHVHCLLMRDVQGRSTIEDAYLHQMVCLHRYRRCSFLHILPRQEWEVFLNAIDVCFVYHVHRSSEFNFATLPHAYWECSRRPKLSIFSSTWCFKIDTNRILGKHVKSYMDLLVLNRSWLHSYYDGHRICHLILLNKEKD